MLWGRELLQGVGKAPIAIAAGGGILGLALDPPPTYAKVRHAEALLPPVQRSLPLNSPQMPPSSAGVRSWPQA